MMSKLYYHVYIIELLKTKKYGYYYHSNGMLRLKEYYSVENEYILSNENGPALIEYHKNGIIKAIGYYNIKHKGKHRINGPAFIYYNEKGSISRIQWFYNDEDYTNKVNNWMKENNIHCQELTNDQYNQMWMEIL